MKQKKLLVIDGQGGRMGAALVSQCKAAGLGVQIIAVGANSAATAAMLKAGADHAATGENAVVVNSRKADVIIGYRADDSYFSFARAFLENRISLAQLERAMKLGGLGRQVVAVSEAAFGALTFAGAETAPASQWHERRMRRDERARRDFDRILHEEPFDPAGVYMLDLMREG